jgi:hypothetical protein
MKRLTTYVASTAILAIAAISTSSAELVNIKQVRSNGVAPPGSGTIDRGGVTFTVTTLGGTLLYAGGPTLDDSSSLDLDITLLIVTNISAGDQSGLSLFPDGPDNTVTLTSPINYGSGSGVLDMPMVGGGQIFETWTGGGDIFTETLSEVLSIDRATPDVITVTLAGTLSDSDGLFVDRPAELVLSADQSGGPGGAVGASITNTASNVPEPSTWAMLLAGFAGLGWLASRRKLTPT